MFLGDAKLSTEKLVDLLGQTVEVDTSETVVSDVEAPVARHDAHTKAIEEFIASIPTLQEAAYLKIGVVKEVDEDEKRVAIVPEGAKRLLKTGVQVLIESNAGKAGNFWDDHYEGAGAIILETAKEVFDQADIIVKIREPRMNPTTGKHELDMLDKGKTFISFVGPRTDQGKELMVKAKAAGVNLLAVDAIPRISRAQSLDVLSSQAKIAGYHAVIQASNLYQRFLNGETTAAGSFKPAKILIIGAGVAGLSAIGVASNIGAIVRAFDTRLETKEQVESLGGEFLELKFDEDGGGSGGYAKIMVSEKTIGWGTPF
jgi:NAD(P) transhydrogenase subunit alpha